MTSNTDELVLIWQQLVEGDSSAESIFYDVFSGFLYLYIEERYDFLSYYDKDNIIAKSLSRFLDKIHDFDPHNDSYVEKIFETADEIIKGFVNEDAHRSNLSNAFDTERAKEQYLVSFLEENNPETITIIKEEMELLDKAIMELDELEKTIIAFYRLRYNYKNMSKALYQDCDVNIRPSALRTRVSRIIKKLKNIIKNEL